MGEHMLARSMVAGKLHAQGNGGENCKVLTASIGATSCDDQPTTLSCPSGEVVEITSARYGRQPGSKQCRISPDKNKIVPGDDMDENCWADVQSTLQVDCGGNSECTVTPSSQFATDANCESIYSYLEVEYTCTATSEHSKYGGA